MAHVSLKPCQRVSESQTNLCVPNGAPTKSRTPCVNVWNLEENLRKGSRYCQSQVYHHFKMLTRLIDAI